MKTIFNLILSILLVFPLLLYAQTVTVVETDNTWRIYPSAIVPFPDPRDTPTIGWNEIIYDDAISPRQDATINRSQIYNSNVIDFDPNVCNGQISLTSGLTDMIWCNSKLFLNTIYFIF